MMDARADRLTERVRLGAFCAGLLGTTAVVLGLVLWPAKTYPSYLLGYVYWMGLTLGCFPILMLHHLVGGQWGKGLHDFWEAGLATLPLMGLLLVPVFLGLPHLYAWMHARPADEVVRRKSIYLNEPAFIVRSFLFFAVWFLLAYLLQRWSRQQRLRSDLLPTIWLRRLSAPGLVAYALTSTFACIDWVMALEPDWFSSIFPVSVLVGQMLCALALAVSLNLFLRDPPATTGETRNQIGNLFLALVLLWAYLAVSQLIIIYAGNLPHEIHWYLKRVHGSWLWLTCFLAFFQFGLPFLLLLFRSLRSRRNFLLAVAVGLLAAQLVCSVWYVVPAFRAAVRLRWSDLSGFVGFGGLWIALFTHRLRRSVRRPGAETT